MYNLTILIVILLIFTVKTEANRWGGWSGGGGNRGNRWKPVGGGGFNSWRQQTFKHNSNRFYTVGNNNNDDSGNNGFHNQYDNNFNQNQHSLNGFRNPEVEAPTISFSHTPSQTSCAIPLMGDSTKFELRCIFPDSEQDEDCSEAGSFLSSGTTATLRCRPPYVSDTGDFRIWVCESGVWKGEFKSFSCTHAPISIPINSDTGARYGTDTNFFSNNNNKPQKNNYHFNKPTSSWSKNTNKWEEENSTVANWQSNGNKVEKPVISGLIPGLVEQIIEEVSPEDVAQPPWFPLLEKWKPPTTTSTSTTTTTTTTTTPKPLPYLPPPPNQGSSGFNWNSYFPENSESSNATAEDTVEPTWFENLGKWKPSSTTTIGTTTTTPPPTTTTTTTQKSTPYLPPPNVESPVTADWNAYLNQKKDEKAVKCPSLSKRTGIQLECLSKSPVPWDPSSFLVSQSNCSTPQVVGTEATYKCEQYYEASLGLTIQYRKCKEDGTWTGGENRFSCALECGKSNPVGRIPLITNGEPTYKAQWPWHAALFFQDIRKGQYDYNCGATLINRKVVLTAAHCVTEFYSKTVKSVGQFRIDLGRYERTVQDEFVQTFSAEEIIIPTSYNPVTFDSDIALIILKGSATIGFHVRPICYPQTQNSAFEELQLSDGSYGTVVGFGKNENGEFSDILHMAKLKVISQQECSDSFADTNFGATLTKSTTFCAGLKNGTNVCSGDSGGGIYFPINSGGSSRWHLQGLVSVGITAQDGSNRCDPTRFSVFTRISPYADWIVRVLSERDAL